MRYRVAHRSAAARPGLTQVLGAKEGFMTDEEIGEIEMRCNAATSGPWQSFIEGRDHLAGDDFIRTGGLDDSSPDIYLIQATHADQDFIAHARQDIPTLIAQVRLLKASIASGQGVGV
jgi:hypothetical protein